MMKILTEKTDCQPCISLDSFIAYHPAPLKNTKNTKRSRPLLTVFDSNQMYIESAREFEGANISRIVSSQVRKSFGLSV